VSVATEVGTDDRLHVGGPAEAGGVDEPSDPDGARLDDVDLHAADLSMVGACDGFEECVHGYLRG
jgi:hypothetical protein